MNIIKEDRIRQRNNLLKPFWSKQHGAYITLITGWIIAIIACRNWNLLQPVVLIFLLSGLNFSELIAEKLKRKSPLPDFKILWLKIYFLLSAASGIIVLIYQPFMKYLIPVVLIAVILYSLLSKMRLQKSVISELILFALFSIFGLLAFIPQQNSGMQIIHVIFIFMFLYFSMSIFTVKARLNKINRYAPVIYLALCIAILNYIDGQSFLYYATAILLLIKALLASMFYRSYSNWKIRTIGIFESITHILFILLFTQLEAGLYQSHELFRLMPVWMQ